jgi:hypothetical protein
LSSLVRLAGPLAALSWFLLCVRWFDAAAPFRPGWLEAVPPLLPGLFAPALLALWVARWRRELLGPRLGGAATGLLSATGLALLVRLPLAWWGAWGYTTADGALSGTMALQVLRATAHDVFIPSEPYSGSLKPHLAASLTALVGISMVRARALGSVLLY